MNLRVKYGNYETASSVSRANSSTSLHEGRYSSQTMMRLFLFMGLLTPLYPVVEVITANNGIELISLGLNSSNAGDLRLVTAYTTKKAPAQRRIGLLGFLAKKTEI